MTETTTEAPAIQRGRDRRHRFPGRDCRLTPRFTADEVAEIEAAAASAGMTTTGFCAEAALSTAREVKSAALDPARESFADAQAELFDARVALGRIGTNLNQAVAALNATGQAPDWLERVVLLCERRMQRLDEVIERVDRRLP
jgi:uncharacterized protein (DUF1778 family)